MILPSHQNIYARCADLAPATLAATTLAHRARFAKDRCVHKHVAPKLCSQACTCHAGPRRHRRRAAAAVCVDAS